MSQNVTLFQIFGTQLRLPFMFGFGSERLSKAFHAHSKEIRNAYRRPRVSMSTISEHSEWETDTTVNSKKDFFGKQK